MNRFQTRLTLQSLDDRIVPDGTPGPAPAPAPNGFTLAELTAARDKLNLEVAANDAKINENTFKLRQLSAVMVLAEQAKASHGVSQRQALVRVAAAEMDLAGLRSKGIFSSVLYDLATAKVKEAKADVSRASDNIIGCSAVINNAKFAVMGLYDANSVLTKKNASLNVELADVNVKIAALQKKGT